MSQTANPRMQRSVPGMVGALVVVVLIALAWVGFSALNNGKNSAPVQTVDWAAWVKAGRAEQRLLTVAPASLPAGWRATSVQYIGGNDPRWHLGMLTDKGKYVGIEESLTSSTHLAEQYVDADAVRGKDVVVSGQIWQSWTDAGGDYALTRSADVGGRPYEAVLVGGSAAPADVRDLVASLTSGTVRLPG